MAKAINVGAPWRRTPRSNPPPGRARAEGEWQMMIPFRPSSDIMPQGAPRWCRIPIHRVHGIQKDENYRAVFTLHVFRGRDRTNLGVPVYTEGGGAARLLR